MARSGWPSARRCGMSDRLVRVLLDASTIIAFTRESIES
jgi:hypothetical protein